MDIIYKKKSRQVCGWERISELGAVDADRHLFSVFERFVPISELAQFENYDESLAENFFEYISPDSGVLYHVPFSVSSIIHRATEKKNSYSLHPDTVKILEQPFKFTEKEVDAANTDIFRLSSDDEMAEKPDIKKSLSYRLLTALQTAQYHSVVHRKNTVFSTIEQKKEYKIDKNSGKLICIKTETVLESNSLCEVKDDIDLTLLNCHRSPIPNTDDNSKKSGKYIEIVKSSSDVASFSGLIVCANSMLCPVCSPIIAERRRKQLYEIGVESLRRGGGFCFVTLTAAHVRESRLEDFKKAFCRAKRKLFQSGNIKKIFKRLGIIGQAITTEVTCADPLSLKNDNGWHYHAHILFYSAQPLTEQDGELLNSVLSQAWQTQTSNQGLFADFGYGLTCELPHFKNHVAVDDVDTLKRLANYLSKNASFEMSNPREKKHQGRLSLAELEMLLLRYPKNEKVLAHIAEAMLALRGTAATKLSPGLAAYFGVEDMSDEDLANAPSREVVYRIDLSDAVERRGWYFISRTRDWRHALLYAAAHEKPDNAREKIRLYLRNVAAGLDIYAPPGSLPAVIPEYLAAAILSYPA